MNKIVVLLHKEWLELKQQRGLLISTLMLPLFFTFMPLVVIYGIGQFPADTTNMEDLTALIQSNPALAGLTPTEAGQAAIGLQMSLLFILLPLILPSVLAAYSIVGEKNNRTLEPLLATPIKTWQLLAGKGLMPLSLSVGLTWLGAVIFSVGISLIAVSTRVTTAIISPGWLAVILLCTPLITAIAIAGMILISSRVNDPRTAQQYSAIGILPFMMLFFGQLAGLLVINPLFAIAAAVVLLVLTVLAVWGISRLFQREVILTRWK